MMKEYLADESEKKKEVNSDHCEAFDCYSQVKEDDGQQRKANEKLSPGNLKCKKQEIYVNK